MSKVRGKDTIPEIRVRKIAHRLGLRFRLHDVKLPGKPDIVFRRHNKIILVHGCFWHRHPGCKKATTPKSQVGFWQSKFDRNVARDRQTVEELETLGWIVAVIWECETKDTEALSRFLGEIFELYSPGEAIAPEHSGGGR